jgi:NADH-quinone oxidoreductase subunit D
MTLERELDTLEIDVNVGPQHPATHGVFRMVLAVDGEKVVDLIPHVGYMHRGAEKLSENMDYRQAIGYQDRTEYCYVMAVEKLAGIEVPERAEYIRVILAELNRIASHYMFVGAFATDLGVFGTAFTYGFREREYIQDLFEEVTGDRLMYSYFRPGGVCWDVPENFKERVRWVCRQSRIGISDIDGLLTKNEVFVVRTRGIGAMSVETAIDYGLSGPVLRACGLKTDLRREEPYSIYDRFDFDIPTGNRGDCFDRYLVRMERCGRRCASWNRPSSRCPTTGPSCRRSCPGAFAARPVRSTCGPRTPAASTASTWSPRGATSPTA